MALPVGTVTFLFTDIQGSAVLWERHPDDMPAVLARHDDIVRSVIEQNGGRVFKAVGDAFCAAFQDPLDAARAAIAAQQALARENWDAGLVVRVRMGMHTGTVEFRNEDYFGTPVNRVARLTSIAHGGQIVLSSATQELIRDHLPEAATLQDMGEHRLKDLVRPEIVFQLCHPDLPSDFPPLRSLSNPGMPHNLPLQVTTFIGREKEITEVKSLLASARLVTLLAAGGTGKSRLSLQVAADVLDRYSTGVWFIELAAVEEPSQVAPTVSRALNVVEVLDVSPLQTLARELKERKMLLILDNCEHLIDACAELADALLRTCPDVRILATSREALKLPGEYVYPLHVLATPEPAKHYDPRSLEAFDAVKLFVDRAASVKPGFVLTESNADAVAAICRRLDGMPLALELAAARVRVLSVQDIDVRLNDRFRLLTGGSRSALPRQQTLKALIDWSYDLLNEAERRLFERLSVFAGGWTLAAAEAVCVGDPVDEWDVLDLLMALADKSLVISEAEGAEARFRFLNTLRDYSRARMVERGEMELFAERHSLHFLAALRGAVDGDESVPEAQFPWFSEEADNFRAALEWMRQKDRVHEAAEMAVALRGFWARRGWLRDGFDCLSWIAERGEPSDDPILKARVLKASGWFAYLLGDLNTAQRFTEESVRTAYELKSARLEADALSNLAAIVQSTNDFERAEAHLERAIEMLQAPEDEAALADHLVNLGLLQSMQEKFEPAQNLFRRAQAIYEREQSISGLLTCLCNQSDLALRQFNWADARSLAETSLGHARRAEHLLGKAFSLANLAKAAYRLGDYPDTNSAVREAVDVCTESDLWELVPLLLITRALCALSSGDSARSVELAAAASALRSISPIPPAPEERQDLMMLEELLRGGDLERAYREKQAQFRSLSRETLIARLRPQL